MPSRTLDTGAFALAVGRRLLLDLPAPNLQHAAGGAAQQHVRLAREVNRLRRLGDEAAARAAGAEERHDRVADDLEAERDRRARMEAERDRAAQATREAEQALQAERDRAAQAAQEAEQALQAERDRAAQAAQEAEHALQAERDLAAQAAEQARREGEQALEQARTESLQRLEEAVAAQRARTLAARHEAKALRAQLEALRREDPGLRPPRALGPEESPPRPAEEPPLALATRRIELPEPTTSEQVLPATEERATDPLPLHTQSMQTVRVLNPRPRRPRRELAEEAADANDALTPPELAQIGARHIEPGTGAKRPRDLGLARPSDAARTLALTALAVFAIALLIIILGVRPL